MSAIPSAVSLNSSVASSFVVSPTESTSSAFYSAVSSAALITSSVPLAATSNETYGASSLLTSDMGGTGSFLPNTTPAASNSLYSNVSAFPTPTNTIMTIEQVQSTSSVPASSGNISRPPSSTRSSMMCSSQPLGQVSPLATHTQIGTALQGNSFFNNYRAVTGTFVVVAILTIAIFVYLCFGFRRWFQRRTHRENPKTITLPWHNIDRVLRGGSHERSRMSMIDGGSVFTTNIGVTVSESMTKERGPQYGGPLSNHFAIKSLSRNSTELAIDVNSRINSPVPSTPSIYPPSLPPMETEDNITHSMVYSFPLPAPFPGPPPRPPRRRPLPSSSSQAAAVLPSSQTMSVSSTTVVPSSSFQNTSRTDHPTNVQLERASTLLRRSLVDTQAVPRGE